MKSTAFFLLCSVVFAFAQENAPLPEGVAATVNGQPIPEKLVQAFIKNNCDALGIDLRTEEGKSQLPKVRVAVIGELIERALIGQETEKRGIAPSAAEIDAAEKSAMTFWGDENRYAEFLRTNGFTREEYREHVLRSAAAGKALSASLAAEVTVTAEEVQDYYEKHRNEPALQWPERVTAAHIFFNTTPGALGAELKAKQKLQDGPELDRAIAAETERKRKLAEEVRSEATKSGADFAALAKKYSDDLGTRDAGGNLGTFPIGTHDQTLDKAAFAAKPGEIAPVVRSDAGFHIVKVQDHKPASQRSLEEAGPSIRQQLTRAKQVNRLKEWLADARAQAAIVTK